MLARDVAEYLPSLDGLRAVAVTMVLSLHVCGPFLAAGSPLVRFAAGVASRGKYGVDLFFVLSGFLITSILLATRGKRGYFRSFYSRRALRIFPAYYVYLALLGIVVAFVPFALGPFVRGLPWYALYLTNIKLAFFLDDDLASIHHLWTLAVEEQFYVLWPIVVALLAPRALAWLVGVVVVAVPIGRWLWLEHGAEPFVVAISTWTRMDALLLGAAVALVRRHPRVWSRLVRVAPVLALVAVACLVLPLPAALNGSWIGLGFSAVLVLSVAADERGASWSLLCSRPLRRLGVLSYSVYLFHFFVALRLATRVRDWVGADLWGFAAALLVVGVVSYAVAALSYRWIETPALELKRYVPRP